MVPNVIKKYLNNLKGFDFESGRWPHRYRYFLLTKEENSELLEQLEKDHFFDFHVTNTSRQMVAVHQIVAFYYRGGIHAYRRGKICAKGQVEVHHINGNTWDNRPSNLIYLPTALHVQITKHQRVCNKYLRVPKGIYQTDLRECEIWNCQGRDVVGKAQWIAYVAYLTLKETAMENLGIKIGIKDFVKWINKVARYLSKGIDTTFISTPKSLIDKVLEVMEERGLILAG